MTARAPHRQSRPAFELIEEAVMLLRQTPPARWLAFYLGAAPFWLAFLYFVADVARSAFAEEHLARGSLLLALLYLWKKSWQAGVALHWRAQLLGEPAPAWSAGRVWRLVAAQATLQPWGLVLRPIAWALTLPVAWVSGFFQHAKLAGAEGGAGRRVLRQTLLWPGQLHVLYVALGLFSLFVWLNTAALLAALPSLWKMFTGVQTMASRSGLTALALNGTFPLVVTALTALVVEPLWIAVFVLRGFYGESIGSGADLLARLKSLRSTGARVALALFLFSAATGMAAAAPAPPATEAAELDRRIGQVLERREYAWRLPRNESAVAEKAESTWLDPLFKWMKKASDRVRKWFEGKEREFDDTGSGNFLPARQILYALFMLVGAVLGWALWRAWRRRGGRIERAVPLEALPDLRADTVLATELPEEGWLRLMREMLERGELRLALRAAYLGGLAQLAERQLLSIARYKSNRDYGRELDRRARARTGLLEAFAENVRVFERVWYGAADFSPEELARFHANVERMRGC